MNKYHNYKTLDRILTILEHTKSHSISIKNILNILSGKGRVIVLLLLSLPFCQPIQIPGLSTPFGLVIAFMGIRMSFGKQMWLPNAVLSKKVPVKVVKTIADKMLLFIKKIRPLIHPRLDWCCHHFVMIVANGLMIASLGLFLALPLPIPFSNLVAAWSLLFIGLGILEDDGLLILIGYAIAFLALFFLILILLNLKQIF